jgi:rare lipoprotein A
MKRLSFLAFILFLSACATSVPVQKGKEPAHCKLIEEGLASWYGNEMAIGKRNGQYIFNPTASGETFIPEKVSAAHKTLPFGTVVKVVLDKPGADPDGIDVRINDRGPFVRGRVIDLSRGAARKLGMHNTQPVKIYKCGTR